MHGYTDDAQRGAKEPTYGLVLEYCGGGSLWELIDDAMQP